MDRRAFLALSSAAAAGAALPSQRSRLGAQSAADVTLHDRASEAGNRAGQGGPHGCLQ